MCDVIGKNDVNVTDDKKRNWDKYKVNGDFKIHILYAGSDIQDNKL